MQQRSGFAPGCSSWLPMRTPRRHGRTCACTVGGRRRGRVDHERADRQNDSGQTAKGLSPTHRGAVWERLARDVGELPPPERQIASTIRNGRKAATQTGQRRLSCRRRNRPVLLHLPNRPNLLGNARDWCEGGQDRLAHTGCRSSHCSRIDLHAASCAGRTQQRVNAFRYDGLDDHRRDRAARHPSVHGPL